MPISDVNSIIMEKLALAGESGGARPPPFTLFTITYKVALYALPERADSSLPYILYTLLKTLERKVQYSGLVQIARKLVFSVA